ncbi:MAG: GerMN domain-containing protein [Clostridia bacterium]|nr:GerMN domain-containing protein [Clostridia bacterium]
MKLTKKVVVVLSIALLSIGLTIGCTNLGLNQKPADKDPVQVNPNPSQEKFTAKVYFSDQDAMFLVPEEQKIAKDNRSQAELLVDRLIAGPTETGHGSVIPEGTKLLSLEIVEGIAYVNFSREVKTNHWGGSAGENMTIYSVVNTLTQLPEVDRVQFLIDGEKEESIWGHSYTMEPFEFNKELVDPRHR